MTTPWSLLLDEYERFVSDLERRLDAELWDDEAEPFSPPPAPVEPPRDADHRRFAALRSRAGACEERLQAELAAAGRDLRGLGARREAARAYGDH